jgi:serine/threonine protein kinase
VTDEDKTRLQVGKRTGATRSLDQYTDDAYAVEPEPEETLVGSGPDLASPSAASRRMSPDSVRQRAELGDTPSYWLAVGDVLKDRFQILEVVGEGGMGTVFKAVDVRKLEAKSRNPHVAIKVLNPNLAKNAVLVAGLQRECEKAQELSHPNIITVYDFDRDGDHVFMSMEYLVGRPLSKIIRGAGGGGIGLELAWPIIRGMGEALAYAHKKHIVHSDFKPANVVVTDKDEVKVLDFGIASRLGQSEADETIFNARAEGGLTPPYASFEMLNGSRADPRDDIYAFGLVVYELLTGKHPYDRKPASTVFLEQRSGHGSTPAPVRGLSRKQWQLLKAAIEILQDRRPQKMDAWLHEFDPKNHSKHWYLIAGGALLLLGATVYVGYQWSSKPVPGDPKMAAADSSQIASPETTMTGPPIADAGADLQGLVGRSVILNGGLSRSLDGGPISYVWRLIAKPAGSKASLLGVDTVSPQLPLDQAGLYTAELVVTDAKNRVSLPVSVSVQVEPPMLAVSQGTEALHEATSRDGLLYLAASQHQYHIGQELQLNLRPAKSGYLRVAYLSSTGEINELLPNQYQPGKVKAGMSYRIPPKADSFKLKITGPVGVDRIVAVFSESPIPKTAKIVNTDGGLVDELQTLADSAVTIRFSVVDKNG